MKIFNANLIFGLAVFSAVVIFPNKVFSAGLVPDCGDVYACNFCDFIQLINNIINFFIFLSVPISVIIFAWIGWTLIVEGNKSSAISSAKDRFGALLKGLFLMLSAWLIVTTITTMLLKESFTDVIKGNYDCSRFLLFEPQEEITSPSSGNLQVVPQTSGGEVSSEAEKILKENSISLSSSGDCSYKFASNCTSLEGIQADTVDGVVNLANGCKSNGTECNVVITGGTEIGHSQAHTDGKKVDIGKNDPNFNAFMETVVSETKGENISAGTKYSNVKYGNATYTIINEGDHWDVEVIGS
ncbi:hypothetical protein L6261_04510 [Candidatus Parcubacteria bacterium]|nr:hypothetical protein [Candidatus Parcubacteria bacterium]